jgi:hypothetical protein
LATTVEDVLHVHSGRDGSHGGGEVTDQIHPLLLTIVVREPRLLPVEVLAGA